MLAQAAQTVSVSLHVSANFPGPYSQVLIKLARQRRLTRYSVSMQENRFLIGVQPNVRKQRPYSVCRGIFLDFNRFDRC